MNAERGSSALAPFVQRHSTPSEIEFRSSGLRHYNHAFRRKRRAGWLLERFEDQFRRDLCRNRIQILCHIHSVDWFCNASTPHPATILDSINPTTGDARREGSRPLP
jgi:hypothetical protein